MLHNFESLFFIFSYFDLKKVKAVSNIKLALLRGLFETLNMGFKK